jgi:hypothetical protein
MEMANTDSSDPYNGEFNDPGSNNSPSLAAIYPEIAPSPEALLELDGSSRTRDNPSQAVLLSYLGGGRTLEMNGNYEDEDEYEYEDVDSEDNSQALNDSDDGVYSIRKDSVFYESNQEPDAESARVDAGSKSLFLSLPQELLILVAQLIQPEDAFDLALCCRALKFLIQVPSIGSILHEVPASLAHTS